jgi:hypothetical protein
VPAKKLMQLVQRYLHTLTKLFSRGGVVRDCALQVVDDRQKVADECLFLGSGTTFSLLRRTLSKVVEVGSETQMNVFLSRQLCFKRCNVSGKRFRGVVFWCSGF